MFVVARKTIKASVNIHQNNQTNPSKIPVFEQTDLGVSQNTASLEPYRVYVKEAII